MTREKTIISSSQTPLEQHLKWRDDFNSLIVSTPFLVVAVNGGGPKCGFRTENASTLSGDHYSGISTSYYIFFWKLWRIRWRAKLTVTFLYELKTDYGLLLCITYDFEGLDTSNRIYKGNKALRIYCEIKHLT